MKSRCRTVSRPFGHYRLPLLEEMVEAYLGHYQGIPWRADVDALWGFDDSGKVMDFQIRKSYDRL
jgi:hypothetical protein